MRFWPSIGTRSLLWGAHAFWVHPIVVALAWRKLYGRFPNRWECLAIFCHDLGYWGCDSMDGDDGKFHPYVGAFIAADIADAIGASDTEEAYVESLVLGHSRSFCAESGEKISKLCDPDKYSILYEPAWFYWIRTILSGEIHEYRRNEEEKQGRCISSTWAWLCGYRRSVKARFSKTK